MSSTAHIKNILPIVELLYLIVKISPWYRQLPQIAGMILQIVCKRGSSVSINLLGSIYSLEVKKGRPSSYVPVLAVYLIVADIQTSQRFHGV